MSKEKWRALVDKYLAGASFDKLLDRTPEGITIEPLYTERPVDSQSSPSTYVQGTNAQTAAIGLCIRVEGDRSVAAEELDGGATSLWIDVGNDGALDADAVSHADLVIDIAKSTPPRVARPPDRAQTNKMTRSTLMPDDAARSRLSATARMALPIRVFCSISATSSSTTRLMMMHHRLTGVIAKAPEPICVCTW